MISDLSKSYYACKGNRGKYCRKETGGGWRYSAVLEKEYLFASKNKATEFALERNLKVVSIELKEIQPYEDVAEKCYYMLARWIEQGELGFEIQTNTLTTDFKKLDKQLTDAGYHCVSQDDGGFEYEHTSYSKAEHPDLKIMHIYSQD